MSVNDGGNQRDSGMQTAPYGSWRSPITGDLVATAGVGLGWLLPSGDDVVWTETRPREEGRYVVVRRRSDGTVADVTPPGFSARTLVHEYGGGAAIVHANATGATVWFSNFADQRLYRQDLSNDVDADGRWRPSTTSDAAPLPITPAPETERGLRYADGRATPDGRLLVVVRERHPADERVTNVVNELVSLPADGSAAPRVIASGHDFYSSPHLSADGRHLAWICWNHPNMPWDGTELWVADLAAHGSVSNEHQVAGGPDESVVQPAWSPDGRLHYVSDRSGWWNIYRLLQAPLADGAAGGDTGDSVAGDSGTIAVAPSEPVAPLAAEFAKPHWVFGLSNYTWLSDGRLAVFYSQDGLDHLALVDEHGAAGRGRLLPLSDEYTSLSYLAAGGAAATAADVTKAMGGAGPTGGADAGSSRERLWFIGASAATGSSVVSLNPATGVSEAVRHGQQHDIDRDYLSLPQPIEFPTEGGQSAYALFYPPTNKDFQAPTGELPPLIIISHGGPTSAAEARLSLDLQFFTSHGFAVADVNYGGSSGYGRAFRRRLIGLWGVVDVDDSVNAALYLARTGRVDGARLAIRGGSAGGWTTLCCLAFRDTFAAGASHFGVAELERFAQDTHKFESRYLDSLVGPYPQEAELYRSRAPLNAADKISCPVIIFQGLEDKIVPPSQAEIMVAGLAANHLPYAYVTFPGEQHGYRKAESIKRALEAELYFYSRVFGFVLAEPVEPVKIENLD
ncbi:MAG: prolyl oligopeptidase family serine peptidase [Thermoleophilia bacterium]